MVKILKTVAFCIVLAVLGWLLFPDADTPTEADTTADTSAQAAEVEVKYVLRFAPGMMYMPGTVPMGVGKALTGYTRVAKAFEARFPDTRIEIINVPNEREYLVTQLSSGNAPDVLNVNVEDVWVDIHKGWYLALDPYLEAPNPFIVEQGDPAAPGYEQWWDMFKYQAISRGKAAPDGLNYCLSYDMVETAIFYNKDIFRAAGVSEPKDWEDFIDIMTKIKQAGYQPITLVKEIFTDWNTDLFFDQIYYDILPGIDLYQDPVREQYLQGYLDWDEICFLYQQGFFTERDPRYAEVWRIMHEFRQFAGQTIMNTDLVRDFVSQKSAMMWNHSQNTYRLTADPDLGFEWGIFYLPQFTKETTQYAAEVPMCVIGGSASQLEVTNSAFKDTGDPATSERLQRVIAFLQFICLPENCEQIVNEYPGFIPNITGVEVLPSLKPFAEILERRYTTTKWTFTFDLRFYEIQTRMLELFLNDGIDLDGFIQWQKTNIETSAENLLMRKGIDFAPLEKRWEELAPVRAGFEDLPDAS